METQKQPMPDGQTLTDSWWSTLLSALNPGDRVVWLGLVPSVLREAREKHPEVHPTLEHSLAVLEEEVHELRMEIYKKESERNQWDIEEEALHVAGCAIRLLADNYYQEDTNYVSNV